MNMVPGDFDERLEIDALEDLLARRAEGDPISPVHGGPTSPEAGAGARFGRFRLVAELGAGGQGEVWLAEDPTLGRRVALKVLHRGLGAHENALLRFKREAESASRLDHPGLCAVYEIGRDEGRAWMAMRYVEGPTLAQVLADDAGPPAARAGLERYALLVERMARAVHAAHEAGVVHRDLKPSNVVVAAGDEPVVLDFGLARLADGGDATLTQTGAVFGTPAYMAPERLRGAPETDRRADVYSLGAILYRALTGRPPREGPTLAAVRAAADDPLVPPRATNAAVPRELELATLTALAPETERRYATALEFAEDLRRWRAGEPLRAAPPSAAYRVRSWVRRHRALSASFAALFAVLVAGLWIAIRFGLDRSEALAQRDRVADVLAFRALLDEETRLWPLGPELVPRCDAWLAGADDALRRAAQHAVARVELRRRAKVPRDGVDAFFDGVLGEIAEAAENLAKRRASVASRRERSATLDARTLEGRAAEAWTAAAARVRAAERYRGLALPPKRGLLPLGPDPASRLEEFALVDTGAVPERESDGALPRPEEADAVVLVLVPAGVFTMGAAPTDPYVDVRLETPAVEVTLDAFYCGKYEITQAQWARMTEGDRPSYYFPGTDRVGTNPNEPDIEEVNPVESVKWTNAAATLGRHGLALPTEAQWEYACRGGKAAIWSAGDRRADLRGYVNVAGLETRDAFWTFGLRPEFRDGHERHSPIGAYRPNAYGLHDCHGNVNEWCRDALVRNNTDPARRPGDGLRNPAKPETNRIVRGGSFQSDAVRARSAARNFQPEDMARRDVGVRAVADLR